MLRALEEAHACLSTGDVPIGALVIDATGQLLSAAHNERERGADPTGHAELLALREAARHRGHWRLDDCTLVVTLEPCLMCAGGILNARISRLVYGTDDAKAGAVRSRFAVLEDPRLNHRVEVLRGVESEACAESLRSFFASLRAEGQKLPPPAP